MRVDFDAWGFLDAPAPPTVDPSRWRHAQLNAFSGLFRVTEGIYQLRGFRHSSMTLIEGKTGWIVIEPLTADEVAARRVPVIAPEGFLEEATSENVMVGGAIGRRSRYQFGRDLPLSATGFLDTGLGKEVGYGT